MKHVDWNTCTLSMFSHALVFLLRVLFSRFFISSLVLLLTCSITWGWGWKKGGRNTTLFFRMQISNNPTPQKKTCTIFKYQSFLGGLCFSYPYWCPLLWLWASPECSLHIRYSWNLVSSSNFTQWNLGQPYSVQWQCESLQMCSQIVVTRM